MPASHFNRRYTRCRRCGETVLVAHLIAVTEDDFFRCPVCRGVEFDQIESPRKRERKTDAITV